MQPKKILIVLVPVLVIICGFLTAVSPAFAEKQEKVLHSFNGNDGALPSSGLIFDTEGNLYGTTSGGGNQSCYQGCGTVFKLTPGTNGKWTRTVVHIFEGKDGSVPDAGLIFDGSGSLYGTTSIGGNSTSCGAGCGTVFKLAPNANGWWTETVLHSFNGFDGANPYASLIFDEAGNLYGTTWTAGAFGYGNVFKLAPKGNGEWTETVLHSFNGKDGNIVYAGLIFGSDGNLYGATARGGASDDGTIFKLTPGAKGKWTYSMIHVFNGANGIAPIASLIQDDAGNLYGTTQMGGHLSDCGGQGCGTIFKLAPAAKGKWTATVLHKFNGDDGAYPSAGLGLILDAAGSLYGTTEAGGNPNACSGGCGLVFQLTPDGNGKWTETVLHAFGTSDGAHPLAGLIFDLSGNLFGTTVWGGDPSKCSGNGCGLVFEITP